MKNETVVNQVIKIANENQRKLLAGSKTGVEDKVIDRAWYNEGSIANAAESLEHDLERGIRELKEALSDLRNDKTMYWSSAGILQSTNLAIDHGATEIQLRISSRKFYEDLLK